MDSRVSKTDDISSTNISDVGHIAYVFIDAPVTCSVSKVGNDHLRGIGEGVVALVAGDPHAALTKPNEVASLVSCNICDKTKVFRGKPASCVLRKVLDNKGRLVIECVTQDNDSVETKADDRSEAGAGGLY